MSAELLFKNEIEKLNDIYESLLYYQDHTETMTDDNRKHLAQCKLGIIQAEKALKQII